ncbi:hypothetical protein J6590_046243 [Homalodisca vitripennis]|nr:hypothetical protein J6590_046243 [Homalodisca vitripennis]
MRILTKICSDEYVRNPRQNKAVTVCGFSDLLIVITCQSRPAKWMNSINNIFEILENKIDVSDLRCQAISGKSSDSIIHLATHHLTDIEIHPLVPHPKAAAAIPRVPSIKALTSAPKRARLSMVPMLYRFTVKAFHNRQTETVNDLLKAFVE